MRTLLPVSACLALLASPALGSVTFTDGTMSTTNWLLFSSGAGSTSVSDAEPTPGDTARSVIHTLPDGAGLTSSAMHAFGNTQATSWRPNIAGPVLSLSYSLDFLPASDRTPSITLSFAVRQAQIVYIAAPISIGTTLDWQNHAASGLTASNFSRLDGLPGTPDFSGTGQALRFGFATSLSSAPSGAGFESEALFDNFRVTIVPSPASAALLGLAGVLGARRRRAC